MDLLYYTKRDFMKFNLLFIIFVILFLFLNCNKFQRSSCGIFVEDYLYCKSVNIGDYIQSLAALQYCKKKRIIFIERDSISKYKGEKVKLIMNAWWRISNNNSIPSNFIKPLYISYHLDNPQKISLEYIKFLKKYEPIGCRDTYTKNIFQNYGIKSYFSGCLTFTLGKTYKNKHTNNDIVIFSDCFLCYEYKNYIMNIISNITNKSNYRIIQLTHEHSKSITQENRFNIANNYLRLYESAFLVLTSLLHSCLPCIGMNTSVILVRESIDKRFSGLINFTNYIFIKNNKTEINILTNNRSIINPDLYQKYSYSLDKRAYRHFNNRD